MKKILSVFLLSVILFSSLSFAQTGMNPNSLPPNEASEYLRPLSTWFGTYLNSGTYYDADVSELFGFKFNLIGLWTLIPDDQKTFQPNPQISGVENVDPSATVFGNKASYYLGSNGFYTYPTGLSLNAVPMGIYQFAGSFYNTELMLRFFPKVKFGDAKVGIFGFGIKHEISSHIPLLPVHISVQILYNNFALEYIGDDPVNYTKIKSNNFAFNVHASKTFAGMFIVYSGLQYESSTMDFGYYFEDENNSYPELGNQVQNLSIDGDNSIRFTLGGAVKLGFFVVNADVNLTKLTTFTTGLSLDF
ncbi:MAG: hypothetical protein MUO34_09235 [Ignavibacteriaceae bacterium]|nr:hypothetical protein [Ignavibacteriaceae bacterium]